MRANQCLANDHCEPGQLGRCPVIDTPQRNESTARRFLRRQCQPDSNPIAAAPLDGCQS